MAQTGDRVVCITLSEERLDIIKAALIKFGGEEAITLLGNIQSAWNRKGLKQNANQSNGENGTAGRGEP